jgi:hypothetical protein
MNQGLLTTYFKPYAKSIPSNNIRVNSINMLTSCRYHLRYGHNPQLQAESLEFYLNTIL